MAIDPVLVEFGAKIDQLIAAVGQVNSNLDSVKQHAEGLSSGFDHLKDMIVTAFSVEAIIKFIENMATLGEKLGNIGTQLGASVASVAMYGAIAQITGSSIESFALGIERLSLNVQKSTRDAFNPQADALRVLGLRAKELIGQPLDVYIEKLRSSVSQFNASLNLTNAVMTIGGRGIASMIPLLKLSDEEWGHVKASIKEAQDGLAAAQPGMADTHLKLELLSISTQSLGARIFTVLKPAIDLVVTSMTKWIQSLDSKTIAEFAKSAVDVLGTALIWVTEACSNLSENLDELISKMRSVILGGVLGGALGLFGGPGLAAAGAAIGVSVTTLWNLFLDAWNTGSKKGEAAVNQTTEKIKAGMAALRDAIDKGLAGGTTDKGPKLLDARAINEGLAKASADAIKIAQDTYQEKSMLIKAEYADFFFNENAKTAALLGALKERYLAEVKAGEDKKLAWAKYEKDYVKIQLDAMKAYEGNLNQVFGALSSSFNGQIRGLLAGTTKFKDAFKTILGDMIVWAIQQFVKMGLEWAAHQIAMTVATTTGVTARKTAEAGAEASALPIKIARYTSDMMANAALVFAGVFANQAPILGPAAAAEATAASGLVLAAIPAGVPKFDVGSDWIAKTGLATVHAGEKIIPAQSSGPYTGAGGGGHNITLNVSAVDAKSFAQMINANPGVFNRLIAKSMRDHRMPAMPLASGIVR